MVLSLLLQEGGQGLACLCTQVHSFCLQVVKRLLYSASSDVARSHIGYAFLHCLQGFWYDQQLLYLQEAKPGGTARFLIGLPQGLEASLHLLANHLAKQATAGGTSNSSTLGVPKDGPGQHHSYL